MASVNEEGYPRICVLSKIKNEGINSIWVSTGTNGTKTKHFRKNPKTSTCFRLGGDSVTLIGDVSIVDDMDVKAELWQDWFINHFSGGIEDPEYCILRFDAFVATIWIDMQFETINLK